jgi:hypothetical protein
MGKRPNRKIIINAGRINRNPVLCSRRFSHLMPCRGFVDSPCVDVVLAKFSS